jgi:hypothetical protein
MATGVRLACGTAGARVGAHVHLAHEDWAITSDVAPGDPAMLDALLDAVLPGAVGCYVYPRDAVLHLPAQAATGAADLQRVLARHRRERADGGRRLNQRTVASVADGEGSAASDASSSDDDDDDDDDVAASDDEDEPPPAGDDDKAADDDDEADDD